MRKIIWILLIGVLPMFANVEQTDKYKEQKEFVINLYENFLKGDVDAYVNSFDFLNHEELASASKEEKEVFIKEFKKQMLDNYKKYYNFPRVKNSKIIDASANEYNENRIDVILKIVDGNQNEANEIIKLERVKGKWRQKFSIF
ncbi:MAG: hypothetical protein ACK5LP_00535 [Campylobacteraceae bacterium]